MFHNWVIEKKLRNADLRGSVWL